VVAVEGAVISHQSSVITEHAVISHQLSVIREEREAYQREALVLTTDD
jgi:hypothetical protein